MDWLGVPLNGRDRIIGVLAVQSYSGEVRYTEEDRDLLVFVSSQIAQAVERKRAEEMLRANELRLRTIVAALPDLVLVLSREGRYLEIHTTGADNLILPRESLLGRTIPEFLPAPVASLWMERIEACLLERAPQTLEYALDVLGRTARLRGPHRSLRAGLRPDDHPGRDGTDEGRGGALLDPVGDEAADRQHGRRHQPAGRRGPVPVRQPVARARHGLDPGELLGADALDLVHPEDRETLRARFDARRGDREIRGGGIPLPRAGRPLHLGRDRLERPPRSGRRDAGLRSRVARRDRAQESRGRPRGPSRDRTEDPPSRADRPDPAVHLRRGGRALRVLRRVDRRQGARGVDRTAGRRGAGRRLRPAATASAGTTPPEGRTRAERPSGRAGRS